MKALLAPAEPHSHTAADLSHQKGRKRQSWKCNVGGMQSSHHLPRKSSALTVMVAIRGGIPEWNIKKYSATCTISFIPTTGRPPWKPLSHRHWSHSPTPQEAGLHFSNVLPMRTHSGIGIDDVKQGWKLKPSNEFSTGSTSPEQKCT